MSHESKVKSNEWYTPKYIFDKMGVRFDLDVASPINRSHCCVPTGEFITKNSLELSWDCFVWMNPPYGNQKMKYEWIDKFIKNNDGIALMPDRSSAPWWQYFARNSDGILLIDGKVKFIDQFGNKGESPSNGSVLFCIGQKGIVSLENADKEGLDIFYLNRKLA